MEKNSSPPPYRPNRYDTVYHTPESRCEEVDIVLYIYPSATVSGVSLTGELFEVGSHALQPPALRCSNTHLILLQRNKSINRKVPRGMIRTRLQFE